MSRGHKARLWICFLSERHGSIVFIYMEIKSTLTNRAGQVLDIIYHDLESLDELGNKEKIFQL